MFNNLGNLFKHVSFADKNALVYSSEPEASSLYLTQSELQQIQDVMRQAIRCLESECSGHIARAQAWKLRGDKTVSGMFYKDVAKAKKRIKSLAAIQAKLKHSIITLG